MNVTKEQAKTYDMLCDYLSNHPEVYEEITKNYLEKNNFVKVEDVRLGDSKQYKPRAIYKSFCSHDCETWYECPVCHRSFGSRSIYHSGKKQCPECKTELSGLD